jgi:hypothetical protein
VILLDQFFLWLEAKGWVYYRKSKRKGGMGDILTGFGFADPGARYLEEARREHVLEDEDDGDDESKKEDGVS